jgi:hypothetical protein
MVKFIRLVQDHPHGSVLMITVHGRESTPGTNVTPGKEMAFLISEDIIIPSDLGKLVTATYPDRETFIYQMPSSEELVYWVSVQGYSINEFIEIVMCFIRGNLDEAMSKIRALDEPCLR